ncbi:MAG: enoyl-CoA hydratase/isomerase family protein [Chloroflexi bacterium]|nr:enoyl-CoA hydratase/isomerase family protein [Chloroflexota bacterium]
MEYKDYKFILWEKEPNGVAKLILNRPEKLNAMNSVMEQEVEDVFERVGGDSEVKVIILKGAGRMFSSGRDVSETVAEYHGDIQYALENEQLAWELYTHLQHYLWHLWNITREIPQASIAQLHGRLIGAGYHFAMNCDLIFASEDCLIGYPNGLPQAVGASIQEPWPLYTGMLKAKEYALRPRPITGLEAAQMGLVNAAYPADRLDEEVYKLACEIARAPLEFISVTKAGINKFFEAMGLRHAVEDATVYHAMGVVYNKYREFRQVGDTQGWRARHEVMKRFFGQT